VADLDLDAIEAEPCITTTNGGQKPLVLLHVDKRDALVAEVRRLRDVIEELASLIDDGRTERAYQMCQDVIEEADRG